MKIERKICTLDWQSLFPYEDGKRTRAKITMGDLIQQLKKIRINAELNGHEDVLLTFKETYDCYECGNNGYVVVTGWRRETLGEEQKRLAREAKKEATAKEKRLKKISKLKANLEKTKAELAKLAEDPDYVE